MEGAFDRTSRFAPGCALGTVEEVSSDGYFIIHSPVSHIGIRACVFIGFCSNPSKRSRHNPAARCGTYRRDMDNLKASLGHLPVELRALVLSHIEQVKTRQILVFSSTFRKAFSLPGALPRTFDFEGVAGDVIADCLVRLLDDDRMRSLEKERAVELIGVCKDRLFEFRV